MKKATLFKKIDKDRVQCQACSWYCQISKGQTGICGIRKNINGDLYLLVYGKPTGIAIDPIEKKPLFHFLPGTQALSFGTFGCNFGCLFCQNWYESQTPRLLKQKSQSEKLEKLIEKCPSWPPEKIVDYALSHHLPSIAYTYNEPAVFFEYALDTARLAHKKGIKNVFVSNGYESKEAFKKIKPFLDGINVDLKSFREEFYRDICKAKLAPVLENIKRIYKLGIWLEVTTLIIPQENDQDKELTQIAQFLAKISPSIPWHISAFHPDYKMLDKPKTPLKTLIRAYEIGRKAGLKYIYVGNVMDPDRETTYCPKCGEALIRRFWHETEIINLGDGKCAKCGEKIEGVWKN